MDHSEISEIFDNVLIYTILGLLVFGVIYLAYGSHTENKMMPELEAVCRELGGYFWSYETLGIDNVKIECIVNGTEYFVVRNRNSLLMGEGA